MNQLSDYHRERVQSVLAASPLVPVIAIKDPDDAIPLCRALVDGGIRVLEITLRTEHGVRAIEKVRKAIPEAWVGAGTVTSIAQYRQVESAGAQFVITPGVTEAILEFGVTSEAPLLPGVSTVSELMMGYALGYREFKFFPAEVAGGIPALKAFSGPFPDVVFCPTGGISRQTARDYLALPNVRAVGGSWLTPAEAIAGKDWQAVSEIARGSLGDL
ncbi:bifunctional 4-hydroxy-2-oxoglutarate aldolase/2-dehydro-3-deoxy-phosphogluconate aldolase [Marinobacter nauticus]|jgi:2-dehydro-3-deoxyphosphogluconate aldolase/(4S)-4-hydroxy-2-oxoglutarate aldolase|uniref:bifunctional 4-hydroxy-2-oxoglutarate aldolase/2-dehydro-3-deoxy-phosphogluconate aldolase n=1 Tax=Marinobacter nauticus TaxID=2743 RepID=UPI001A8F1886|nr:bifunctional 4-hydroxy-2-oxoglutarate aldolase/2-dehydro-3-deoxy-phosphogluconate aldolase [Marinobacter nauticus]MBN8237891.1 bifunctional 4-hydroxy-2-oxoglutarate aldolase/2-dehydro-3-deoxy-phosphogluconate aldolase [Marinobacter nauticus]MCC4269476.1 bifunctional 4-hydroxy-2-oxoglutarate aldolase/2-dehydro-3-deoxy-phosphogluconate aldolase [Marinobacter nauticus]